MGGNLTLTGTIDVGLMTLDASGNITQTGGILHSHTDGAMTFEGGMAMNSGGTISLPNANIIEQTIGSTGFGSQTAVTNEGELAFGSAGDATINLASSVAIYAANVGGQADHDHDRLLSAAGHRRRPPYRL